MAARILMPLVLALTLAAPGAGATIIDFDALQRGEIVTTQYALSHGVTIDADHFTNEDANAAIIFDTLKNGSIDRDLQGPGYSGGNLADANFGNILILPEDLRDRNRDGFVDRPNDEGSRPAGVIGFSFADPILDFSLDLIDVERPGESGGLTFFSTSGEEATVSFGQLADEDPSLEFVDHGANRLRTLLASDFEFAAFERVEVRMGGSGGLDNIRFTPVPEPSTALLLVLGLAGIARAGRARRG